MSNYSLYIHANDPPTGYDKSIPMLSPMHMFCRASNKFHQEHVCPTEVRTHSTEDSHAGCSQKYERKIKRRILCWWHKHIAPHPDIDAALGTKLIWPQMPYRTDCHWITRDSLEPSVKPSPVIDLLERWSLEGHEFEASLNYIRRPYFQKKKKS